MFLKDYIIGSTSVLVFYSIPSNSYVRVMMGRPIRKVRGTLLLMVVTPADAQPLDILFARGNTLGHHQLGSYDFFFA